MDFSSTEKRRHTFDDFCIGDWNTLFISITFDYTQINVFLGFLLRCLNSFRFSITSKAAHKINIIMASIGVPFRFSAMLLCTFRKTVSV